MTAGPRIAFAAVGAAAGLAVTVFAPPTPAFARDPTVDTAMKAGFASAALKVCGYNWKTLIRQRLASTLAKAGATKASVRTSLALHDKAMEIGLQQVKKTGCTDEMRAKMRKRWPNAR